MIDYSLLRCDWIWLDMTELTMQELGKMLENCKIQDKQTETYKNVNTEVQIWK